MKNITFTNPHRKKHFDFFNGMNHPHFNISANVEITGLLPYLKSRKLPITPSIVYLIARTANEIPEFRWRIRGKEVVEHDIVSPSFTVPTEEAAVFSFCTVPYHSQPDYFIKGAVAQMEAMRTMPSLEDEEGRDDYLFLSAFPWVSFTGIQHAMQYHPSDSIPRITWGKFFDQQDKTFMPVAVQAHHAVVDGSHMGRYFELLEKMTKCPDDFLK